jgi:two-component system nitrate/nitrite sensor histidine kinase NarX
MANAAAYRSELSKDITCYALTHQRSAPCRDEGNLCPVEEVTRTKKPVAVEHSHCDSEGNRRVFEVHGHPIFDEDGDVTQIIEYTLDITERKLVEKALQERTHDLGERVKELNCLYGIAALVEQPGISLPEILQGTVDLIPPAWQYPDITGACVILDGQEFRTKRFTDNASWRLGADINLHGQRHGTVEVCYLEERPESDEGPFLKEERHLINAIAARLGRIVERVRAEAALQRAHDELELRVQERTAELVQANEMLRAEINKRKRVAEELRWSEERFRQLAENINEVFWMTDLNENRVLYVSPAYERMWGRPRDGLYQRPESILEGVHPEDYESVHLVLEKQLREETDETYRIVRPEGSVRWIRARTFPIWNVLGEVYRIAGIAEDITERMMAYQTLEQRVEERTRELSTLLDISRHVALTLELEPLLGLILDRLKAVVDYDNATIFKLEDEVLSPLAHRGDMPQAEVSQLRLSLKSVPLSQRITLEQETVIIPDLRDETPLAQAFRDATGARFEKLYGQVRSLMGVPLAIKDRTLGILALQHTEPDHYTDSQADLMRAFANQAAVAIENTRLYEQAQALATMEERQRLARDLHDAVSQTLFSASLAAEVLPRLWDRDPDEGRRCLEEIHHLTRGALAEMRTLLLELRPAVLTEVGLDDLLRQLVEASSGRGRLPIDLTVEGQCALLPDVQVTLYRIAQEALSNIVKHAEASRATVSLLFEPPPTPVQEDEPAGRVVLRIKDDGRGFALESIPADRLGVGIMRERAAAIGAAIGIESQIGQGTQLQVVWPQTSS